MSNLKKIPLAQTTLSNDFTDNYKSEVDSTYQNSHTHSNSTALNNVGGTNTGDETQSTILTKLCANTAICTTASSTEEKTVTLSGFTLVSGATIRITFSNANTSTAPTLNVNSTGATSIAGEDGTVTNANNPFFVPAGATVEFTYNGTNWVYKNKIITSYVNGTSWYRKWTNGYKEQGGRHTVVGSYGTRTITFPISFSDTNYTFLRTSDQPTNQNTWSNQTTGSFGNTRAVGSIQIYVGDAGTYINYSEWIAKGF